MVNNYIQREIFPQVSAHLEEPEITLITGSRQVGKTVLLGQLKDFLIQQKNISSYRIFYYNLDLVQDWEMFQKQADFIEFLKARSPKNKIYVFVDEAQKVPEAARFFKGIYDSRLNVKLILSGSSSLELKAKFKETLAGRKIIFQLSPFTFFEFLKVKDEFLAEVMERQKRVSQIDYRKYKKLYEEYIIYGGYPPRRPSRK